MYCLFVAGSVVEQKLLNCVGGGEDERRKNQQSWKRRYFKIQKMKPCMNEQGRDERNNTTSKKIPFAPHVGIGVSV
jgi:hypothetical protein